MKYIRLHNYKLNEDFIDSYDNDKEEDTNTFVDNAYEEMKRRGIDHKILPFLSKYRMIFFAFVEDYNLHIWLKRSSAFNKIVSSNFWKQDAESKNELNRIYNCSSDLYRNIKPFDPVWHGISFGPVTSDNDILGDVRWPRIFEKTVFGKVSEIFCGVFNYFIELLRNKTGANDPYLENLDINSVGVKSHLTDFKGSKNLYSEITSYLGTSRVTKDSNIKDILENFIELLVAALNKGYEDFPRMLEERIESYSPKNIEKYIAQLTLDPYGTLSKSQWLSSDYKDAIKMYYSMIVLFLKKTIEVFNSSKLGIKINISSLNIPSLETYYKKILKIKECPDKLPTDVNQNVWSRI